MNGKLFLMVAACVAAGVLLFLGQRSGADDNTFDAAAQLQQLRDKVAALEKKVAELEKRSAVVMIRREGPALSEPATRKNWHAREFNGSPYYIIPLHGN